MEGKVDRLALLEAEAASYHGIGTCTFYGTANSNQMMMEVMGLHLPGASFVPPDSPLRYALTDATAQQITRLTEQSGTIIYQLVASLMKKLSSMVLLPY